MESWVVHIVGYTATAPSRDQNHGTTPATWFRRGMGMGMGRREDLEDWQEKNSTPIIFTLLLFTVL